jgi:hypothetical protein
VTFGRRCQVVDEVLHLVRGHSVRWRSELDLRRARRCSQRVAKYDQRCGRLISLTHSRQGPPLLLSRRPLARWSTSPPATTRAPITSCN